MKPRLDRPAVTSVGEFELCFNCNKKYNISNVYLPGNFSAVRAAMYVLGDLCVNRVFAVLFTLSICRVRMYLGGGYLCFIAGHEEQVA